MPQASPLSFGVSRQPYATGHEAAGSTFLILEITILFVCLNFSQKLFAYSVIWLFANFYFSKSIRVNSIRHSKREKVIAKVLIAKDDF